MTAETIKIWVCNAADCDAKTPEGAADWYDGIHTHGCPPHAQIVADHKASVTSNRSGRGSRSTLYWYLTCSCGWVPSSRWSTWNSGPLLKEHMAHLKRQTREAVLADQQDGGDGG